jgi:hypothetical protein
MEMEYEIHHWELYQSVEPSRMLACYLWLILTVGSDENTKEEDLIHPEDIAHFKLHDECKHDWGFPKLFPHLLRRPGCI